MKPLLTILLMVAALTALSGCGVKDKLELPKTEKENILYR